MTLEAQVKHLVTYRDTTEGTLIYTVFAKKYQKRCKKGVPPVFDRKIDVWGHRLGTWSPTVTPLRGLLFTPVLPKSVKNGAKSGYPLFLTVSLTRGVCRPGGPSRAVLRPHFGHQMVRKNDFWACTPPSEVTS